MDIAYRMVWTESGLDQVVGKSVTNVEKLNTSTSSLISRLEKKAAVSDMGADAFALATAKASGATAETLNYISSLQNVVQHIKDVKNKTAEAAAETNRLASARSQLMEGMRTRVVESHVDSPHDLEKLRMARQLKGSGATTDQIQGAMHDLDYLRDVKNKQQADAENEARRQRALERHSSVPDNDELRSKSEYDRKQREQADERARRQAAVDRRVSVPVNEDLRSAAENARTQSIQREERLQRAADQAYRQQAASKHGVNVPDNEQLRQASESARLAAGERALVEVTEQLRRSTRALREEEAEALRTRIRLSGATNDQRAAALSSVDSHQNDARAMRTLRSMTMQDDMPLRRLRYDPAANQKSGRGAAVGLELSRAVEDSIAGGAYGGVKGAIMGASNNISQMGAMMGPTQAIVASMISMTAILGVTAYTAYEKWGDGADKAAKASEKLRSGLDLEREGLQEQIKLRKDLASLEDVKGKKSAEKTLKDKQDTIEDLKAEQALKRKQVGDTLRSVGFGANHTLQDVEDARRDKDLAFAVKGSSEATGFQDFHDIKHDRLTPEFQNDLFKLQRDADLMSHKIADAEKVRDKAKGIVARETIADQGTEMEDAKKSRQETREEDADARLQRRNARKQKTDHINDMQLSMLVDRDSNGNIKDDDRRERATKAELDRRARNVQIQKAQKEGLLTDSQAGTLMRQSTETRDRDIRKANEQQQGQKAQALDIRSSEGMSQLLKALNQSKDDIARQQLDVSQQTLQAIKDAAAIKPLGDDIQEIRF